MSGQFASGTPCAPCNALGHFCPAYDTNDQDYPVCISCLDQVLCPTRRGGQQTGTAKPEFRGTRAAEPRKASDAERPQAAGTRQQATVCSRGCGRPTHRGQCLGVKKAQVVRAEPEPPTKLTGPRMRVVPIAEVPAQIAQTSQYDGVLKAIAALAPDMSVEVSFDDPGQARLYARRMSNVLRRRLRGAQYRRHGTQVFFWKRSGFKTEERVQR